MLILGAKTSLGKGSRRSGLERDAGAGVFQASLRRGGSRRDSAAVTRTTLNVHAGDWIVRMDQPYTALVRTVLAIQRFRPDDPSPYDDTGWSLDQLRHVTAHTIADSAILTKPMSLLTADVVVNGSSVGAGGTIAIAPLGDWRSATLPWKMGSNKVTAVPASGALTIFTAPPTNLTRSCKPRRPNE